MSSIGAKPISSIRIEVGLEDLLDHPADGVVGQSAVEGLDEIGGGEVAHPLAGVDGVVSEGDEEVGLARPRRSHETEILLGPDPLEADQVVERRPVAPTTRRRRTRRGSWSPGRRRRFMRARAFEASREAISASTKVRRNSSGFQRWVLATTSSSGAQAAHGAEAQPPQPGFEVGGEGGRCRAHDSLPDGVVAERADGDQRAGRR